MGTLLLFSFIVDSQYQVYTVIFLMIGLYGRELP